MTKSLSSYDYSNLAHKAIEKRADELCKLYYESKDEFEKRISSILSGVYGNADPKVINECEKKRLVKCGRDFFCIVHNLK